MEGAIPALTIDDAIHEIAIRIPPDQPDRLALASMLSSSWRRVITSKLFRENYLERYQRPPLLGYLCTATFLGDGLPRFVPVLPQSNVPCFKQPDVGPGRLLDSRDGLILSLLSSTHSLDIWDLVTGNHRLISVPSNLFHYFAGAVVCGHQNRLKGDFKVIFIGTYDDESTSDDADDEGDDFNWAGDDFNWASFYSSKTGSWSEIVTLSTPEDTPLVDSKPPILINDVLHFALQGSEAILTYHMISNSLSLIALPEDIQEEVGEDENPGIITTVLGNTLGYAYLEDNTVYIFAHVDLAAGWKLEKSVTFPNLSLEVLVCSVEGTSTMFVQATNALYTIDIDTCEAKPFAKADIGSAVVPYKGYCIPVLEIKPDQIVELSAEDGDFHLPSQVALGEADNETSMSVKDVDSKDEAIDEEEEKTVTAIKENEPKGKEARHVNIRSAATMGKHMEDVEEDDSKSETWKKRAAGSLSHSDKKPKVATPSSHNSGDKKGAVHVATHPAKKSRETPAADEMSPKSGVSVTCDLCPETFNSVKAQEAHWDAKHKAAGK